MCKYIICVKSPDGQSYSTHHYNDLSRAYRFVNLVVTGHYGYPELYQRDELTDRVDVVSHWRDEYQRLYSE